MTVSETSCPSGGDIGVKGSERFGGNLIPARFGGECCNFCIETIDRDELFVESFRFFFTVSYAFFFTPTPLLADRECSSLLGVFAVACGWKKHLWVSREVFCALVGLKKDVICMS